MKITNKRIMSINLSENNLNKVIKKFNKSNGLSLPDMFVIFLHNQTILNDKLNKLLAKKSK